MSVHCPEYMESQKFVKNNNEIMAIAFYSFARYKTAGQDGIFFHRAIGV